jgi:hypothetical protein
LSRTGVLNFKAPANNNDKQNAAKQMDPASCARVIL